MEQTSLEQMAAVLRAAGLPVHTEIPALEQGGRITVHRQDGSVLLGRLRSNGDGSADFEWEAVAGPSLSAADAELP